MSDTKADGPEIESRWPVYLDDQAVIGWNLLDFAKWVRDSKNILEKDANSGNMPILAMPPVQRSAVWRPKQVLDLWDSLMRGMPIGAFYLVCRSAASHDVVVPGTNKASKTSAGGFDLLDGQQRVRALMLGVTGPAEEKRCLWIDLGAPDAMSNPCLRLTSKAQPFGYDAKTGEKLSLDQRRKGRERLEAKPDEKSESNQEVHILQCADGIGQQRRAYDLELFDCEVTLNGQALQPQPPLPYGATDGQTFKLHDLLAAWQARVGRDVNAGVVALVKVTGQPPSSALTILHEAFCKVEQAQIALVKVNPDDFRGGNLDLSLLELFERVGAGGTPLSGEERLYSIYKHYVPEIRNTVDAIHRDAGRVLPPTKIITAALRIANARTDERKNNVPDPITFAKNMKEAGDKEVKLRTELTEMLPTISEKLDALKGNLHRSFIYVRSLLSYDDDVGGFWLPDVMLAALPPELWHVLVFWAVTNSEPANRQLCREEAVRFALFWHLCVTNNEKAAVSAFAYIKTVNTKSEGFPGSALYQRLVGATRSEAYAHALPPLDEFKRKLCRDDESPVWRTDEERFVENKLRNDIGSNWWWHGRKMLPWLQRDYVREAFPGYVPLSEHEDDLPYDLDHICP